MNRKLLKVLQGVFLGLFVVGILVFFGYKGYMSYKSVPRNVRITNITDSSVTVSWVSDVASEGMAYYSSKKVLPGFLAFVNGKASYDDRDWERALEDVVEGLDEKADDDLKLDLGDDWVGEVRVRDMGEYFVHHVVLKDMDPESEYFVRVGDGFWSWDLAKVLEGSEGKVGTISTPEEINTPRPVFGRVLDEEGVAYEDALVFIKSRDGEENGEFLWYSTVTNGDGGYYIDTANFRDVDGNLVEVEEIQSSYNIIVQPKNFEWAGEYKLLVSYEGVFPDIYVKEVVDEEKVNSLLVNRTYAFMTGIPSYIENALPQNNATVTPGYSLCVEHPQLCADTGNYSGDDAYDPASGFRHNVVENGVLTQHTMKVPVAPTVTIPSNSNERDYVENYVFQSDICRDGDEIDVECVAENAEYIGYGVVYQFLNSVFGNETDQAAAYYMTYSDLGNAVEANLSVLNGVHGVNPLTFGEDFNCINGYCGIEISTTNEEMCNNIEGYSWSDERCMNSSISKEMNEEYCLDNWASDNSIHAICSKILDQKYTHGSLSEEREVCINSSENVEYCFSCTNENCFSLDEDFLIEQFIFNENGYVEDIIYNEDADGYTELPIITGAFFENFYIETYELEEIQNREFWETFANIEIGGNVGSVIGALTGCVTGLTMAPGPIGCAFGALFQTPVVAGGTIGTAFEENWAEGMMPINVCSQDDDNCTRCSPTIFGDSISCNLPSSEGSIYLVNIDNIEDDESNVEGVSDSVLGTTSISIDDSLYYIPEIGTYNINIKGENIVKGLQTSSTGETMILFYSDTNGTEGFQPDEDTILSADALEIDTEKIADIKTLELNEGINIISFDYMPIVNSETPLTASYLSSISNRHIKSISQFSDGRWSKVYGNENGNAGGTDFVMMPGIGYLVVTDMDLGLEISGLDLNQTAPVIVGNGWNLVGINGSSTQYTAKTLIDSFNTLEGITVNNVTWWPTSKGMYEGLQVEGETQYGFDFGISGTNGYFVRVSKFDTYDQNTCVGKIWRPGYEGNDICIKKTL